MPFIEVKNLPQRNKVNEYSLASLESLGKVPTRVRKDTKKKQFHGSRLIKFLHAKAKLGPEEGLIFLTNVDLYPKDGWTFVFGCT